MLCLQTLVSRKVTSAYYPRGATDANFLLMQQTCKAPQHCKRGRAVHRACRGALPRDREKAAGAADGCRNTCKASTAALKPRKDMRPMAAAGGGASSTITRHPAAGAPAPAAVHCSLSPSAGAACGAQATVLLFHMPRHAAVGRCRAPIAATLDHFISCTHGE